MGRHLGERRRRLEALKEKRTADQLDVFPRYLSREGLILEAGVGLGATMIWLREQGFHVIGLDYAVNALRAARAYDPALDMQAGDVHALPYRSGSLHGYLSFGVLEHFEHGMGPALREANRVLVPGGTLVLTIPYPNVVHRLVGWKRRLLRQSALTDEHFYESAYTQHDLIREVKAAGFMPVVVKPTSHAFTLWGAGRFARRGITAPRRWRTRRERARVVRRGFNLRRGHRAQGARGELAEQGDRRWKWSPSIWGCYGVPRALNGRVPARIGAASSSLPANIRRKMRSASC